ncbi:MAG: 50S ribosomal protein L11 methyltransferase, partial [Clostridia bacterium]|nr:50S ribosomal protein L11 methyltransferase [Clostridia bacterium]
EQAPADVKVKAWFPVEESVTALEGIRSTLARIKAADPAGSLGLLTLETDAIREEDWAENWKQYFKPFRVGERLVVKPTWETWEGRPDDLIIEIDPGMAFGTGTHETTALCISLIEKYYRGGRLLDVGTGSGILAIAAALLGAKDVLAVDIDPDAVRVAQENVANNRLQNVVTVREGDLLQGLHETFDFAAANILAPVICMLAAPLTKHLTPGGLFVCSGIIAEAEEDVHAALSAAGYEILEILHKGDWVAFAARRS